MRGGQICAVGILIMAVLISSANQANADEAPLAESLFHEGVAAMERGDLTHACGLLAGSHRLDPGGGTLLNLQHLLEHELAARAAEPEAKRTRRQLDARALAALPRHDGDVRARRQLGHVAELVGPREAKRLGDAAPRAERGERDLVARKRERGARRRAHAHRSRERCAVGRRAVGRRWRAKKAACDATVDSRLAGSPARGALPNARVVDAAVARSRRAERHRSARPDAVARRGARGSVAALGIGAAVPSRAV